MSVKYFDKTQNKWVIFPGSIGAPGRSAYELAVQQGYKGTLDEWLLSLKGKDAYTIAVEGGYKGTEEEFNNALTTAPIAVDKINNADLVPIKDSANLVLSGGVKDAIDSLNTSINTDLETINNNITTINNNITNIVSTEISNQIKSSIVDNLISSETEKSLSAKQGKILKDLIDSLANLQITVVDNLPSSGESNIIYLVKKSGTGTDVHDEYVYIEEAWEKIGTTDIDLSDYYTKSQVNDIINELDGRVSANSSTISNIVTNGSITSNTLTIQKNGTNIITSWNGSTTEVANITVPTSLPELCPTSQQIIDALGYRPADSASAGSGDVTGPSSSVDSNIVLFDGTTGKIIKDSNYNVGSFAVKNHTHTVSQIIDFPEIPEAITVDSTLSTTSENPVQNKVITNQLNNKVNNATLGNYVKTVDLNTTLEDYYTSAEVDSKISAAGGGDVVASGNFVTDYIIVGAGTKSIKNSGQTLSNLALKTDLNGYATQSWVNSQGFITEAGDNYYPTTFTWTNGTTAGPTGSLTGVGMSAVSFNAIPVASATQSGVVTTGDQSFAGEKTFMGGISAQDADISDLIIGSSLEFNAFGRFNYIATSTEAGGIKIGATASGVNLPLVLNSSNQAYIAVTKGAVTAALGFTPANVNDIPEIPITLPNPYALNVTAGGSTTSYTGSSASTIDLDNIYAKKLPSVDTPGKPGLYFASSGSVNVTEVYVTENNPDAIILVANTVDVTFGENYHKMDGIDSLSGGNYKCYCITYVRGVVLVNGAIYG